MSIASFLKGATAGDRYRDTERARTMQEKTIQLAEEKQQQQRNLDTVYEMTGLATDLGIARRAGEEIDTKKLAQLLAEQRASGKFDPKLERFITLIGNQDLSVERNPGFKFTNLQRGPDGTLTMSGTYDGDSQRKFATTNAATGQDSDVAFSTVEDVAALVSNQYNQTWNKPGASAVKRSFQLKGDLIEQDWRAKKDQAEQAIAAEVGELTNDVETALLDIGGPSGAAAARKMKLVLAGKPYQEQLEILREYANTLELPEAQPAATAPAAATAADAEPQPSGTASPAKTVSPREEAQLQKQLEVAKKQLERQREIGDRGRLGGGTAYIEQAEKRVRTIENRLAGMGQNEAIEAAKSPIIKDEDPVIQAGAQKGAEATDKDIIEGKVSITQEEILALQERLKAKGITKLEEMINASYPEQQMMRAMLSEIAANQDQRKIYLDRFNNVMATGNADFDSKTLGEARVAEQNANTSAANSLRQLQQLQEEVGTRTANKIQEASASLQDALYGSGEGKNRQIQNDLQWNESTVRNKVFGTGGAFSQLFEEYQAADGEIGDGASGVGNITGRKRDRLRKELNNMYSQVLQAMNESGEYEWSWLTRDTAPGVFSDDTFKRIKEKADGTGFNIIDPASGQPTGDQISKSQLLRVMGKRYYADFARELEKAQR